MKPYEAIESLSKEIGCDTNYISKLDSFVHKYSVAQHRRNSGSQPSKDDLVEIKKIYNDIIGAKSGKVSVDVKKDLLQNIGISERGLKELMSFEQGFKYVATTNMIDGKTDQQEINQLKIAYKHLQEKPKTKLESHTSFRNIVSRVLSSIGL